MTETATPTTHDYTRRMWGHDYTITQIVDDGQRLRACGWGRGIKDGDYLLLRNGAGSTRYHVASVSYYFDPSDMWRADLDFAPRQVEDES